MRVGRGARRQSRAGRSWSRGTSVGQLGGDVHRSRAELGQQREDGLALLVADQDDDPRLVRATGPPDRCGADPVELGPKRGGLGLVDGYLGSRHPAVLDARQQLADHVLAAPSAQVAERLLDGDPLGPAGGDAGDAAQGVVGAVAGRADDDRDRRRAAGSTGRDALGHVEERVEPGLVVGEVDDHEPVPETEQVEPSRRAFGRRAEVLEAVRDLGDRRAEGAGTGGRRQRVGDVVARQAADRDREVADGDDRGPAAALDLDDAAALARRSRGRRRPGAARRRPAGRRARSRRRGLAFAGRRRRRAGRRR